MNQVDLLSPLLGALGALLTLLLGFGKLKASFKKEIREEMESEIELMNSKMKNLEDKIDQDIDHVKMIYNSEIKNVVDKIESLRDQVQQQHSQLVGILTKLIS